MSSDSDNKATITLRLSLETFDRLYQLTQRGVFENEEAAIEAAVECLYEAHKETPEEEYARKKQALDRVCGALNLGIDRTRWRELEEDRLEYEVWKNTGKR